MATELSKSQQWAVLISTILASAMASIDATALNVALPALQKDLGINGAQLLWVVNSYALFLSALLLVGGSLGDALGRKKIFLIGILIFTVSSVFCGFSTNANMLILGRSLQGVGAALMVPGSLSIISALFPESKRGWAIGAWSMFSAFTTVGGPALGGWLAGNGWWRGIFFINIPIAIITLYFLIRKVPESKNPASKKVDFIGGALATIALAGLTYGFIEAPGQGFEAPVIIAALSVGFLSLIGFVWYQGYCPHPMMPLSLFKSRMFSSTNLLTLFLYGALGGFLFFFPLNLIQIQGYPPEIAGLTMLPFGIIIAILSRFAGSWSDKVGVRVPLIIGPAITAIGFYMYSIPEITAGVSDFWLTYFPAILVSAVGMGITVAPLTTAVMNAVSSDRTGVASGVNNAIARTAAVLAVSVMGSVTLFTFQSSVNENIADLKLEIQVYEELQNEMPKLAEAQIPEGANPDQVVAIQKAIDLSFVKSFQFLAIVASIMAAISAVVSLLFMEKKKRQIE